MLLYPNIPEFSMSLYLVNSGYFRTAAEDGINDETQQPSPILA
jgi:hypothetical protein